MEQYGTKEWTKLLPTIQFNLNTSKPQSTKIMPFEVFFNKKPNFGNKKWFTECDEKGDEKECVEIHELYQIQHATKESIQTDRENEKENESESEKERDNDNESESENEQQKKEITEKRRKLI